MTMAPMSASSMVQYGPARTRLRSATTTPASGPVTGRPRISPASAGCILVPPVPALAPVAALLVQLDDGGVRPVLRVTGELVRGLLDEVGDVEAHEVHELEGPHRVVERRAGGDVDV